MPHRNRVPLLALVVLALAAFTFIATQLSSGQAPQTSQPALKMKVLRDKVHVKNSPNQTEIATFKKQLQENERQLEDSIPKHVPLKVKVKKEKEAGFKDLKNEQWAREFELEVTNTGTKPIYSLYLYVVTDIKAAAGFRIVFPLYYGRDELGDIRTRAEPTDIPIKPGESVSLKIHPGQLDAWDYARRNENRPFPKHLKVEFQFLSFGDGTGYAATDGQALPRKLPEEEGAGACLPSPLTDPFGWREAPPGSPLSKLLAFNLPVSTWPVIFFAGASAEASAFNSSLLQTCCSGPNCSALLVSRNVNVCVNCPPQNRVGVAICTNPDPPPPSGGNPSSNPDGCPFGYEVSGSSCGVPIACPQPTPTPPSCGENETSQFYGPPVVSGQNALRLFPIRVQRQHHSMHRHAWTIIGYGMCPTMAA